MFDPLIANGRAGLVSEPECWPWSSAVVHCGKTQAIPSLADSLWRNRWTVAAWRDYLATSEAESDLAAIRRCTHTGRPLGDTAFISKLEQTTGRRLRPQSKGRRKESARDPRQASLSLDAPPI